MALCVQCGQREIIDFDRSLCKPCSSRVRRLERKALRHAVRLPKYLIVQREREMARAQKHEALKAQIESFAGPITTKMMAGETLAAIARTLGLSTEQVRKILGLLENRTQDFHPEVPTLPDRSERRVLRELAFRAKYADFIDLAKQGLTLQEIATKRGITRERVRQILSRLNIRPKDYRPKPVKPPKIERLPKHTPECLRKKLYEKLDTTDEDACWNWTGKVHNPTPKTMNGVVPIMRGRDPLDSSRVRNTTAFRISYMLFVGPIPSGMSIVRTCKNLLCCNPKHLQPMTRSEIGKRNTHLRRGARPLSTHCKRGHLMAGENLYVCPKGKRACRVCMKDVWQRREERKRLARRIGKLMKELGISLKPEE